MNKTPQDMYQEMKRLQKENERLQMKIIELHANLKTHKTQSETRLKINSKLSLELDKALKQIENLKKTNEQKTKATSYKTRSTKRKNTDNPG